ncbi:endonuclease domain-containing protein [Hymenobacter daecheongensis]|nr:endonuclease domain-containing protein [Hymenobacter daecheongensis]
MRRQPTPAENLLWQALRNRQLANVKFRRQHAISHFIVDFISTDHHLIIEVDGSVHLEASQTEYDAGRTHELQALGYRVLRFTNEQVLQHLPAVLRQIQQEFSQSI